MLEGRYKVLRIYCLLLKVSSAMTLIVTVALVIQSLLQPSVPPPASRFAAPGQPDIAALVFALGQFIFVFYLLVGLTAALGQWALADYLNAHMDTESNTREMVELMRQQRGMAMLATYANRPQRPAPPREQTALQQYMERNQGR